MERERVCWRGISSSDHNEATRFPSECILFSSSRLDRKNVKCSFEEVAFRKLQECHSVSEVLRNVVVIGLKCQEWS